jgi:hypothetical protein
LGFDTCPAPSVAKMREFKQKTPYRYIGIYIGGENHCAPQRAHPLTRQWVSQVEAMRFGFLPIFVGKQAPCVNQSGVSRFSSDPDTARVAAQRAADRAVDDANALGIRSIIYYDMEAYDTTDATCNRAVNAFVNVWSKRLGERHRISGIYSSLCGADWRDFAHLPNPPDDVWIADWSGRPSVYDVSVPSCFPNNSWVFSQRIKQFRGPTQVPFFSQSIDVNCADGIAAGTHTPFGNDRSCYAGANWRPGEPPPSQPPTFQVPSWALIDTSLNTDIFTIDAAGTLWAKWYTPSTGGWSGWLDLGAPSGTTLRGKPSAWVSPVTGNLEVYSRDSGGNIQVKWYTPSTGGWSGWYSFGKPGPALASDPVVIKDTPGNQDIFATDAAGTLWAKWYTPSTGGWSGWLNLGAPG